MVGNRKENNRKMENGNNGNGKRGNGNNGKLSVAVEQCHVNRKLFVITNDLIVQSRIEMSHDVM